MTIMEAIRLRHSVRGYIEKPIEGETLEQLQAEVDACAREGALHMKLCLEEPEAFSGRMAHYGHFTGVRNYIVIAGQGGDLQERVGYYGERVALRAQQLGLNTCWVALTFSKGKARRVASVPRGSSLCCVIAVGYGATQGTAHRSKSMEQLCPFDGAMPDWLRGGMEAALLAPTALNQQKFRVEVCGDAVKIRALPGPYARIDLGIVRYHFEAGAGETGWHWA